MRRGRWEKSSGVQFARTGRAYRYSAKFGDPFLPPGGPELGAPVRIALVVMTHPKRLQMAEKLAAQLSAHNPQIVCDQSPGNIVRNAQSVLRALLEQTAPLLEATPKARVFGVVAEDDIELSAAFSDKLLGAIENLEHGAAAFSMHSNTDGPTAQFRGWARRLETQIVRTQFAGWRAELLPALLKRLENYRNEGKYRDGWDTCLSWALDELKLIGCVHYPSLVQHSTNKHPSLLGHIVGKSPSYVEAVPDWVGAP